MRSFHEEWLAVLEETLERPEHVVSPRGMLVRERLAVRVTFDAAASLLIHPTRDLNYRFAVAEALWIAGGLNAVEPVARYNSVMKRFSDDGVTLAGAYGPRLAKQWDWVVNQIDHDNDTRQAVNLIWSPAPAPSKDIPCLGGDTVIHSPEGDVAISDLAVRFALGLRRIPVLSFNEKMRCLDYAWCTGAWKSGRKRTIRLTFDDGSTLVTTPDHRLYQKLRMKTPECRPHGSKTFVQEVAAGDLCAGDRVWATHFRSGPKGHPTFIQNLGANWNWGNQRTVHGAYDQFLRGPLPVGFDVHHKNGGKSVV